MLSRKIQKPPAGNPSPLAPGYPGRPCIDFCPMEYRDTRPLTTSRAPLHPRSPLFVTRPLRPPPTVLHRPHTQFLPLSLPHASACPCIAIFNTLSARRSKGGRPVGIDHYFDEFLSRPYIYVIKNRALLILGIHDLVIEIHNGKKKRRNDYETYRQHKKKKVV